MRTHVADLAFDLASLLAEEVLLVFDEDEEQAAARHKEASNNQLKSGAIWMGLAYLRRFSMGVMKSDAFDDAQLRAARAGVGLDFLA